MTERYFMASPYGHFKAGKIKIKNGTEIYQIEKCNVMDYDSPYWWQEHYGSSVRFRVPHHWIEVKKFI